MRIPQTSQETITKLADDAEAFYIQMIDGYQGLREIFTFSENLESEMDDTAWKTEGFIEGLRKAVTSI